MTAEKACGGNGPGNGEKEGASFGITSLLARFRRLKFQNIVRFFLRARLGFMNMYSFLIFTKLFYYRLK